MVFQFIFLTMTIAHPYSLFNLRNYLRKTKSQLCVFVAARFLVSVTERSCTVLISKAECHIS